jgi:hypothetical protein
MILDKDGLERYDMEWTIEGKDETRSGRLYEMHEAELEHATRGLRRLTRRGETLTMKIM